MSNNPHTFVLYSKEQLSFKSKFYILMDLLVTNQASSQMETYFFFGIFYIQMLSGYFSRHLNLLSIEGSKFDKILNYVEKIFRLKDLFNEHYDQFKVFFYIFSGLLVVSTIYFFVLCSQIKRNTFL